MWLGPALFAEGPTDHEFLAAVLQRLCEEILIAESRFPVEISDTLRLNDFRSSVHGRAPRGDRILESAKLAMGRWNLIFVHADGGGRPERVRREQVQPALDALIAEPAFRGETGRIRSVSCAVIPIKEMEAWAVAHAFDPDDASRLRDGVPTSIGLPARAALVETLEDPKKTFGDLAETLSGRGGAEFTLAEVGRIVPLATLRLVPSFRACEAELRGSLMELGLLS